MHRDVLRRLYDLHSWIGLALGLLIYVVSFSGILALFTEELDPWLRADLAAPAVLPDRQLDALVERTATDGGGDFLLLLPTAYRAWVTVIPHGRESAPPQRLEPATLAPLPARAETAADLMTRLHTDLLLPEPVGRYLVGLLGIVLLASALSGLLLHRKMLQEMFTYRPGRSSRLFWTDLHKLLGLWAAPFHIVMALTGAVLGFAGVVVLLAALTAHRGDGAAAMAAMGMLHPGSDALADMLPASRLLDAARGRMPGMVPEVVEIADWGRASARMVVMGNVSGRLVYYPTVSVGGATGSVLEVVDWSREGLGRTLYAMVTPLHYASFGGLAVKLLYVALGLATCVLSVSGLRIWRSRLAGEGGARLFATLTTGVVLGLPAATVAAFWTARALPAAEPGGFPVPMAVLLLSWAATLGHAHLRGSRADGDLGRVICIGLIGFPLQTVVLTGLALPDPASVLPVASVDLAALAAGIGGLLAMRRTQMPGR